MKLKKIIKIPKKKLQIIQNSGTSANIQYDRYHYGYNDCLEEIGDTDISFNTNKLYKILYNNEVIKIKDERCFLLTQEIIAKMPEIINGG